MSEFVTEGKVVLHADAIEKGFQVGERRIEVLRGVDLTVREGHSLSLSGASGCGKSTFLNIVSGLEKPDRGRVFLEGEDLFALSPRHQARLRSRGLGFVFQSHHLIPELNALENVLIAGRIARRLDAAVRVRAIELMERVGLGDRLKSRVDVLSGGERQRVAVARALLLKPRLVLADEPTGNLDEATGGRVMDLFFEVVRESGSSLLLVTHNPAYARQTEVAWRLHLGLLEPGV